MKSKMTATIITSVLNEESNIILFLGDLLLQKTPNFTLEKILIISDGSTDRTVELANSIGDPRIQVINGKGRKGKNIRVNEGMRMCTSDIAILLDADIRIRKDYVLEKLLAPFQDSDEVSLTSGIGIPLDPLTLAEHVSWTSDALWKNILDHTKNTDMYRCEGKVRAAHRRLYERLEFPYASADDVYPYLQAKKLHLGFQYCKEASVRYQLPVTWQDYIKQTVRFLKSKDVQSNFFDENMLEKGYVVTFWDKVKGLIRYFPQNPFWTTFYLIGALMPRVIALLPYDDKHGKWDIISTTKKLRGMNS